MPSRKIVFVTGPTAVGKTDVSVRLALAVSGEIVNADALQVYREVSIASGRPGPNVTKKVPHHLFGMISVTQNFDVAVYNRMAREAVRDIQRRGKVPIVTGGSGMYVRVLLDGIFEQEGTDARVRRRLEDQARRPGGDTALHARLSKVDPQAAGKIHPHDTRRIVRALEVYETLGRPISAFHQGHEGFWNHDDVSLFCLNRERSQLYERINQRVTQMFQAGLLEEVKSLEGLPLSRTARTMIGIREVRGYLAGEYDWEAAKDLMRRNTRRYAKRQMTWFRKESRLTWMTIGPGETAGAIAERILTGL